MTTATTPINSVNDQLYPITAYMKDGTIVKGHGYFQKPKHLSSPRGCPIGPVVVIDGKKVRNTETDSIHLNFFTGFPDEYGWRLKVIDGEISAWGYDPELIFMDQYQGSDRISFFTKKGDPKEYDFNRNTLLKFVKDCLTAKLYLFPPYSNQAVDFRKAIIEYNLNRNKQPPQKMDSLYRLYIKNSDMRVGHNLNNEIIRYDTSNKHLYENYPLKNCIVYKNDKTVVSGFGYGVLSCDQASISRQKELRVGIALATPLISFMTYNLGNFILLPIFTPMNKFSYTTVIKNANFVMCFTSSSDISSVIVNNCNIPQDSIDSVCINNYIGRLSDKSFTFKVIKGHLNAYSRYPVLYPNEFCSLQIENGPLLPFSRHTLESLIREDNVASFILKTTSEDSLCYWRAINEFNNRHAAYRHQIDSLLPLVQKAKENSFQDQKMLNKFNSYRKLSLTTTHADSLWLCVSKKQGLAVRLEIAQKCLLIDSLYSPAIDFLGDYALSEGKLDQAYTLYTKALRYSQKNMIPKTLIQKADIYQLEKSIRKKIKLLGHESLY